MCQYQRTSDSWLVSYWLAICIDLSIYWIIAARRRTRSTCPHRLRRAVRLARGRWPVPSRREEPVTNNKSNKNTKLFLGQPAQRWREDTLNSSTMVVQYICGIKLSVFQTLRVEVICVKRRGAEYTPPDKRRRRRGRCWTACTGRSPERTTFRCYR